MRRQPAKFRKSSLSALARLMNHSGYGLIKCAVHSLTTCLLLPLRFDLRTMPLDFVECLMRFMPTESEVKVLRQYERERRPLAELTDEDRFMMLFSKIERLPQRMTIMAFMGNFSDSAQMLTPVRTVWSDQGRQR